MLRQSDRETSFASTHDSRWTSPEAVLPLARIVVGLHDTPASARVLERVLGLPLATGARVLLVECAREQHDVRQAWLQAQAASALEMLKQEGRDDVQVEAALLAEDPVPALRGAGDRIDADLLVVGRPERPGGVLRAGRSIARELLQGHRSVLAVGREEPRRYGTILAAISLDDDAIPTLLAAARLAHPGHTRLEVLHAYELLPQFMLTRGGSTEQDIVEYERQQFESARANVERLLKTLPPGLSTQVHVHPGDPRGAVADWLERQAADLVVLGPPRSPPLERLLKGSISDRLALAIPGDLLAWRSAQS